MQRFECAGADCEATCCAGWRVGLGKDDYFRIKSHLEGVPGGAERFRHSVAKKPAKKGQRGRAPLNRLGYGYMEVDDDGVCLMLEQGLCALHRDFGPNSMGGVCVTYPRKIVQAGAGFEVSAKLSCPEAARQCLLHADSMELETTADSLSPRAVVAAAYHPKRDATSAFAPVLRQVMDGVLAMEHLRLAERLFVLVMLAKRVTPYYRRGSVDPQGLMEQIDELLGPETLPALVQASRELESDARLALELVTRTLYEFVPADGGEPFVEMVHRAVSKLAPTVEFENAPTLDAAMDDLHAAWIERREAVEEHAGERVDRYLTRYLRNYVFSSSVADHPDLFRYMRDILNHLAPIRFLLVMDDALDQTPSDEELGAAAVATVFRTARAMEHHAVIHNRLRDAMESRGMHSAAHLGRLTRL